MIKIINQFRFKYKHFSIIFETFNYYQLIVYLKHNRSKNCRVIVFISNFEMTKQLVHIPGYFSRSHGNTTNTFLYLIIPCTQNIAAGFPYFKFHEKTVIKYNKHELKWSFGFLSLFCTKLEWILVNFRADFLLCGGQLHSINFEKESNCLRNGIAIEYINDFRISKFQLWFRLLVSFIENSMVCINFCSNSLEYWSSLRRFNTHVNITIIKSSWMYT